MIINYTIAVTVIGTQTLVHWITLSMCHKNVELNVVINHNNIHVAVYNIIYLYIPTCIIYVKFDIE